MGDKLILGDKGAGSTRVKAHMLEAIHVTSS